MPIHPIPKLEVVRKILGRMYSKCYTLYNYCLFQDIFDGKLNGTKVIQKTSEPNAGRALLFAYVANDVIGNAPIDYLEFGVFEGDSIRAWSKLNAHPESRFFGFDTFTGLPEDWGPTKKGAFNVQQKIPAIDDPRVRFIPGLFQDSLQPFLADFVPRGRVVVHMDADLYPSTLYCLARLHPVLVPGSLILFDEFSDFVHEFPAFHDYARSHYRKWEIVATRSDMYKIAFRLL